MSPSARRGLVATVLALLLLAACRNGALRVTAGPPPARPQADAPRPGDVAPRRGDEIVVAGHLVHTGTPVVLWIDAGGYDAYRAHRHFAPEVAEPERSDDLVRYGRRRNLPADVAERVREEGWRLEDLQRVVRQVILHYDAVGTSASCFEVLHDIRGLSAHFLVDLDGTVYQTLDVKERAWHAGELNDVSVGIELANIGAHPEREVLDAWWEETDDGVRLRLPADVRRGPLPDPLDLAPVGGAPSRGVVQGRAWWQLGYTEAQYVALGHLVAALCRILPAVPPETLRDEDGAVLDRALVGWDARKAASGILGHHHVSEVKHDPGPAFDWARHLADVRRLLGVDASEGAAEER